MRPASTPYPLPLATYRLQLRAQFDLAAAAAVCAYLADLGVSHVYTSPYLQAATGSAHGYDITDPHRVNPELGGEPALDDFRRTLRELHLAELVDVVPNHLSIAGPESRWWWDVLQNGRGSRYAHYFDIDWEPPGSDLRDRILLPILGDSYARLLQQGAFAVIDAGGSLQLTYEDHRFPISPDSIAIVTSAPNGGGEPKGAAGLDATLRELNSDPVKLNQLLQQQHYRLAHWRTGSEIVGYRRFFDISSMAGLRVELPEVFADREKLLLEWLADGSVAGVRVDHIDGLRDPGAYLDRLRAAGPRTWILTEKILGSGERLPPTWPVSGTTGYEFARLAGGLLVDSSHERELTELYQAFTGESRSFASIVLESKRYVLKEVLGGELRRVTETLARLCADGPAGGKFTRRQLGDALLELAASMPVYRTYVAEEASEVDPADAAVIATATAASIRQRPDLDPGLFGLLESVLTRRHSSPAAREFSMRFQQFTGPVMAKGLEDTAFYRYYRLVSLNEVGDDPGSFGVALNQFHAAMEERQRRQPYALNATSTHDSKRSEDVRARLHLISEMPERWAGIVERWAEHNQRHRRGRAPSRNDEYLLYQTLVGTWPIPVERLWPALLKSAREAKLETSWKDPRPAYEEGLHEFVVAVLADPEFLRELGELVGGLILPGRINSLCLALLKLTAPGVPDLYQGTEIWKHSLVDPDNRGPVDYGQLRRRLAQLDGAGPATILERSKDGLPKLWLTRQALRLRAARPQAFGAEGSYEPLRAVGPKEDHAIAYCRGGTVITVAPRLVLGLDADWEGTAVSLPRGRWRNHLTGEVLAGGPQPLAGMLREFPVALLAAEA